MLVKNRIDRAGVIEATIIAGINPNDGQPYYIAVDEQGKLLQEEKVVPKEKAALFSISFLGLKFTLTHV